MAIWILLQKIVSLIDILSATSNDMAIFLFKTIAQANSGVSDLLKTKLNLNRRQYYSKLSSLTKAGLIKRKNGKYFLTALGKVVYCSQMIIENALNNYWKLRAIDSIKRSDEISEEELTEFIDTLINNKQIKEFLTRGC